MRGTQSSAQYVGRVSLAVVSTQELLTGTSPGIVMRNFILGEGLGAGPARITFRNSLHGVRPQINFLPVLCSTYVHLWCLLDLHHRIR